MSRYQRPETGDRVMIEGLKQSLSKKYGPHMVTSGGGISNIFYWQQFRDGSFSDKLHQCSDMGGTIKAGNATIRYTDESQQECTKKVVVSAVYDEHGLIDRFTLHVRSEEQPSEIHSLKRIPHAAFCL